MEKDKIEKGVAIANIKDTRETKRGKLTEVDVKCLDSGDYINDVAIFHNNKDFTLKKGDEVVMVINVGDFRGKPSYSTGLDSISPFKKESATTPQKSPLNAQKEVPPEVWEKKDRRITRANSWSHAVKIVEVSLGGGELTKLTEDEVYNLCLKVAHNIEDDIWREEERVPF